MRFGNDKTASVFLNEECNDWETAGLYQDCQKASWKAKIWINLTLVKANPDPNLMWCNSSEATTVLAVLASRSPDKDDTTGVLGGQTHYLYLYFTRCENVKSEVFLCGRLYLFLKIWRTLWEKMSMNTVIREKKLMARKNLAIRSSTYIYSNC